MKRFLVTLAGGFLGTLTAFFFALVLLSAALLGGDAAPEVAPASVLDLDLTGEILEVKPTDPFVEALGGTALTLRDVTDALEKAAADDRIAAVWLRPEGVTASFATLSAARRALERYRESGKPLIASSGANGFSEAGYYLASAADSVFSPPEATFELNGFFLSAPFFAGTLEKLGIEPQVIRAGAYKSAAEMLTNRAFSPENEAQYRELLAATNDGFRTAVAASRPGVTVADLDRIVAEGGIYDARAAFQAGLLDGLHYEEDVRAAFRARTGQDADEELRTADLRDYVKVPRRAAGLEEGDRENRIALVYAVGQIVPGESEPSGAAGALLGSDTFTDALETALRDERTRAIVVRIDSPGGSATASDAMWYAVRRAADRVPVVASMGSVAASGGYYLAAPADTIVADAHTVTGSIGVISVFFDATAFFRDKLGVTFDTLQTGPAAGLYAFGRPLSTQEQAILARQTEDVYAAFVARVAEGRGLPADSVRALGGGRVYTGARAQEVGLVDELGGLDRALEIAAELAGLEPGGYRLRVLPREKPFLERLSAAFGAQPASVLDRWTSPAERVLRRHFGLVEEAQRLHATPQARLLFDVAVR